MTNGEMIQKVFKGCEVCEPIIEDDIIHVAFADKKDSAIGFDWSWWNAEYKEPTTKNDLGVDAISRADAIQAMQDKAKKLTNEDTINGLCGAVAILFDMPSVTPQEPRWIPVSEKLPKAGEYVGDVAKYYLVQNEYGDMLVARYTHSGYWEQIYQLKPYADEIVAWMPLPEPYREVEE